jgi:hypothetical protein
MCTHFSVLETLVFFGDMDILILGHAGSPCLMYEQIYFLIFCSPSWYFNTNLPLTFFMFKWFGQNPSHSFFIHFQFCGLVCRWSLVIMLVIFQHLDQFLKFMDSQILYCLPHCIIQLSVSCPQIRCWHSVNDSVLFFSSNFYIRNLKLSLCSNNLSPVVLTNKWNTVHKMLTWNTKQTEFQWLKCFYLIM